jgi:hypothetical protein
VTTRDRVILLVVLAVAAVAGSWMLVIQPKRTQAHNLDTQVQAVQGELSTARSQVASGLAARAQFAGDYSQLAALGEALPQDDNVPSLMYQIQSAASAAKVDFSGLVMANNSGASAPAPTPTPAPSTSSSSSSGSSPSSSTASSTSAATAAAATQTLPPGAAVGPAGFPTEQFTFTFEGDFFNLSNFFSRLDHFVVANQHRILVSGRLLSLNGISFAQGPGGFPQIQASVSATTYMAPATTGLLNGATPSGPAGTSGTTPASTSTGASPAPAAITTTIR